MRNTLVAALVACADRPKKLSVRRFLLGLSSDELGFIAEYLGGCILERESQGGGGRIPARMAGDRALKMILLREYLCLAGVPGMPEPAPRHAVN